jgi:hypothetical protein
MSNQAILIDDEDFIEIPEEVGFSVPRPVRITQNQNSSVYNIS